MVSTGDIDPVFTSVGTGKGKMLLLPACQLLIRLLMPPLSIMKRQFLSPLRVRPGEVFTFDYTIANRGSVPVSFNTLLESIDSGIMFNNSLPEGTLGGNGDSVEVAIDPDREEVEETSYGFSMTLFFQQCNTAP